MSGLLALFLVKLFDPVGSVMALIAGALCRSWLQAFIAAAIIGTLIELLTTTLSTSTPPWFSLERWIVGVVAAAFVIIGAMYGRRMFSGHASSPPSGR